jgi:hypothetical protein
MNSLLLNSIYTLREVEAFDLQSKPALFVTYGDMCSPIQTSHLSSRSQLLSVPGFADTHWKYACTTDDGIPIFKYVDQNPMSDFVDIATVDGPTGKAMYFTPKGMPRLD